MRGRRLEFWGGGEERTARDWSSTTPSFPANEIAFLIWRISPCRKQGLQLTAQNNTLVVAKYYRNLKNFQDHYKYLGTLQTLQTHLDFSTSKYSGIRELFWHILDHLEYKNHVQFRGSSKADDSMEKCRGNPGYSVWIGHSRVHSYPCVCFYTQNERTPVVKGTALLFSPSRPTVTENGYGQSSCCFLFLNYQKTMAS